MQSHTNSRADRYADTESIAHGDTQSIAHGDTDLRRRCQPDSAQRHQATTDSGIGRLGFDGLRPSIAILLGVHVGDELRLPRLPKYV